MSARLRSGFGVVLLLLWAGTAAAMWRDHVRDPYDASLEGTSRYGHNHEGALRDGLIAIAVELAIAVALVRPWARPSALSGGLGLLVAAACTMFSLMVSMHAGGIIAIHFLWMAALTLYFVAFTIAAARLSP